MARRKRPKRRCGARKPSDGEPCQLLAGHGTSHPGFGRCKWHSGSTPNGIKAAEQEAAKYHMTTEEGIDDVDLQERIAAMKQRVDPSDPNDELALARALIVEWINEAKQLNEALLRWSASWNPEWRAHAQSIVEELHIAQVEEDWERYDKLLERVPDPLDFVDRPKQLAHQSDAIAMMRTLLDYIKEMRARQEAGSIASGDVLVMLQEIASAIERPIRRHVGDVTQRATLLAAIEREIASIRLPSWDSSGESSDGDEGYGGGSRMDA